MRIVFEVSEKHRDGKRIERADKLERRKARRDKQARQQAFA
jgi:hypothetical protein